MQISSRFSIAVHIFTCIDVFEKEQKITSEFLASSIQVNPVIIRNILGQLKKADLIETTRGSGGTKIARSTKDITFYDIYQAVECISEGKLFHFHENPNEECPVGRNIYQVVDKRLDLIQQAMENQMKAITLEEIILEIKEKISFE